MPLSKSGKSFKKILMKNPVEFSNLPPLSIPLRLSKKKLSKSKYHRKNQKKSQNQSNKKKECSYTQVSSGSVKEILKLKNNFPNLLSKKIEDIHRIINDTDKTKPYINMTTKGPSYRQIISIGIITSTSS